MNAIFKTSCLIFLILCSVEAVWKKPSKMKTKKPPHIIVIMGDDIGWNDFGFHGSSQIPTPNIDALGYNGVILNRFYTQAICSPSRAAFLTGKYPMRIGYQGVPLSSGEDKPIPLDVELLPEKLKKLGYKTHLVGKWHLSAARRRDTPTGRGFDTHFGYWNGFVGYFDYFAYQSIPACNLSVWSGLDLHNFFQPQWEYQGQYATELFTKKSLEVIENHDKNRPLFLMLAHLAAHTGANGTELGVKSIKETEEKYSYIKEPMRRRFAEVVNQLDNSVGEVVKKLQQREMLENSIILFFSDNGAQTRGIYENFGSNYPLKGLKFTLLEGGVRGSLVLFSPLLEKKGYINNELMHITDLYPTLLHLAGLGKRRNKRHRKKPVNQKDLDGLDQWDSISKNSASARSEILLNVDTVNGYSGLIQENHKLLNGSYLNGLYDGAMGDTGRSPDTPAYNTSAVLNSDVNQAIQSINGITKLTKEKIVYLRDKLDISSCNGKTRKTDYPCLGLCLFDLHNDPCETENLIDNKPGLAGTMYATLMQYVSEIKPQRNQPVDLKSNPKYYNNTWCTWLDDEECYKTPWLVTSEC